MLSKMWYVILMQKLSICDIPIKSYDMLNTDMYGSIQNNFAEIWALADLI